MLPRDTLAVSPLSRTGAAAGIEAIGDPRQQAFQRALANQLGKALQGEVLAKLTDGSFIVKVAGTPARMLLPPGAQVGADVPLTLVALTPRPTFQVGTGGQPGATFTEAGPPGTALAFLEGGAGRMARAAALLAGAPLTPAADLAALARDDGGASLSAAGKAIGTVLAAAMKSATHASAIVGRAPLLPGPGADPKAIAVALQNGIAGSGLFYESHVAEWAQGQRTLAQLATEPQMQARQAAMDPATAQFISLQLAAHEQAHVAWQGQLWPGQPAQWEIHKDAPESESGAPGEDPSPWQSRLRLRFPLLGELAASVVLAGDQLHIRLAAGDPATGELLRGHAARLSAALEAAGTPLSSLTIGAAKAGDD